MAVVNLQTLPLTPLPDFGIPTVIYTRVSSDATGEERSCNEQETEVHDDLSHYADRMREPLSVIAALRDPNVPASRYSKKDRPDWVRLLQMIESDLVKVVAFWEMPRATRRLTEWAEFAELAEEKELHVFLRGRMYDCRNPGDMAYLTSLVVRGIEEVGHARERIQRTKRSRAEEGRPDGSICFGLRSVYDQRTGALLTREPDTDPWPRPDGRWTPAGLVQEAADRILSGESRWSVCVEWNDRGVPSPRGKRWSVTSLTQILTTTSIAGLRTYQGEIIPAGGWEGIISQDDFREIQKILSRGRSEGRQRNRDAGLRYFCSSWIRCGVCGYFLYPCKTAKTQFSFRCQTRPGERSGCVLRSIAVLEQHVEALVVAELTRPDLMLRFEKPVDQAKVLEDKRRLEQLKRESTLAFEQSLKSGPSRLSVTELIAVRESLGAEMAQIQQRLDQVSTPVPKMVREMVAAGPALVLERWRALAVEQKRSLLRDITDSGHVLPVGQVGRRKLLPGESVDIRFKGDPPFQLLG